MGNDSLHGVVVHTFNFRTQRFKASLMYIEFKTSQNYRVRPYLRKKRIITCLIFTIVFQGIV